MSRIGAVCLQLLYKLVVQERPNVCSFSFHRHFWFDNFNSFNRIRVIKITIANGSSNQPSPDIFYTANNKYHILNAKKIHRFRKSKTNKCKYIIKRK